MGLLLFACGESLFLAAFKILFLSWTFDRLIRIYFGMDFFEFFPVRIFKFSTMDFYFLSWISEVLSLFFFFFSSFDWIISNTLFSHPLIFSFCLFKPTVELLIINFIFCIPQLQNLLTCLFNIYSLVSILFVYCFLLKDLVEHLFDSYFEFCVW